MAAASGIAESRGQGRPGICRCLPAVGESSSSAETTEEISGRRCPSHWANMEIAGRRCPRIAMSKESSVIKLTRARTLVAGLRKSFAPGHVHTLGGVDDPWVKK